MLPPVSASPLSHYFAHFSSSFKSICVCVPVRKCALSLAPRGSLADAPASHQLIFFWAMFKRAGLVKTLSLLTLKWTKLRVFCSIKRANSIHPASAAYLCLGQQPNQRHSDFHSYHRNVQVFLGQSRDVIAPACLMPPPSRKCPKYLS